MDILSSKVFPGSDGHIQVVQVKFSEKEIIELIAKLSVLNVKILLYSVASGWGNVNKN